MNSKTIFKAFAPLLITFIITSALFFILWSSLKQWNIEPVVLINGNLVLFIVTVLTFFLYSKALRSTSGHVILRMMYASMFVRMMICLVAVLIYVSMAGKGVNKGAVFGCMFLYFVYTGMEVAILMKLGKQKKNV